MKLCRTGLKLAAKKPVRPEEHIPAKLAADHVQRTHWARLMNNHLSRCKECSR